MWPSDARLALSIVVNVEEGVPPLPTARAQHQIGLAAKLDTLSDISVLPAALVGRD